MERIAVVSTQGRGDVIVFPPSMSTLSRTFKGPEALKAAREWCDKQGYTVKMNPLAPKQDVAEAA
jgi:hypothetical protein